MQRTCLNLPTHLVFGIALCLVAACEQTGSSDEVTSVKRTNMQKSVDAPDAIGLISGTVAYRERMALTPSAELNIQLQDISLADAAAKIIAEKTLTNPGQVPIDFTLEFDPGQIEERNSYSVRAVINDRGRMLFTSDTVYPVLTRGNGNTAEIQLIAVGAAKPATPKLEDRQWNLSALNGDAVEFSDEARRPTLTLATTDSLAHGYAGCNRFNGGWRIDNGQLAFGDMAVTMMACMDGMDIEQAYLQALGSVDSHEISGAELIAYSNGTEVLRFVADTE